MRWHHWFDWDPAKALQNVKAHKVSFELAAQVLADDHAVEFHVEHFDESHSQNEDRWITYGSLPMDRSKVLMIVWTPRGHITRIISARHTMAQERFDYEKATKR